jgi:hypothetical protein
MKSTFSTATTTRAIILGLGIIVMTLGSPGQAHSQGPPQPKPLPVTVDNVPLPVVDVDNPARQPFHAVICTAFSINGGEPGGGLSCLGWPTSFVFPQDRRGAIEFVSAVCDQSNLTSFKVTFNTTAGGDQAVYPVQLRFNPFSTSDLDASQPVRVYADPSSSISIGTSYSSPGSDPAYGRCFVAFSGHLITP